MGRASEEGTLEQLHKCRGQSRAIQAIVKEMEGHAYAGGKLRIAHCLNESGAKELQNTIKGHWPQADISIVPFTGLCSFYGEKGCIMAAFEDGEA